MTARLAASPDHRPAWSPEAIRGDPLGYLAEDRAAQRALATMLEDVADALPLPPAGAQALLAALRLRRLAAQSRPIEEVALFGLVERDAPPTAAARMAVSLARREAAVVAGLSLELADELDALARDGRVAAPEALGFMLRACFEALRRRLDWVEAAILPQARACLDAARLAAMGDALAAAAARLSPQGRAEISGAR